MKSDRLQIAGLRLWVATAIGLIGLAVFISQVRPGMADELVQQSERDLAMASQSAESLVHSEVAQPGHDGTRDYYFAKDNAPTYHSPIHICLSPDGRQAYVANQTADSVSIIDLQTRKVQDELSVGSFPTHVACSNDGKLLFVTTLYGNTVDVIDLAEKSVVRSIPTGFEPYSVTVSNDDTSLYVANSISNTISVHDVQTGRVLKEIPVGRNPRYLAQTAGSSRFVVGNGLSRNVSIIDAQSGRVAETRNLGRAGIIRQVDISSDGRWAFVNHLISHDEQVTLQIERGWINSNGFSVLDLEQPGHYVTLSLDSLINGGANPWGMALSSDDKTLYVSLAGIHEIAIIDVDRTLDLVAQTGPEEIKALSEDVEIMVDKLQIARRVSSGGIGPRGIVLCESRNELLVANYFSNTVTVLDAKTGELQAEIDLGTTAEPTIWRRGEMLFSDARLCQQNYYSCASCHQEDGTMDGLNWDLINDGMGNPKNAKSLHDVGDTPPAMWSGVRNDMIAAVAAGQRFLGFIPEKVNHEGLVAFLTKPRRAPNPYRNQNSTVLARGERLFERARCHICHIAPLYTDRLKHDLGFGGGNHLRSRFDTPSLRECYRTGPYLHDGRAATLEDIFTDHNPDDIHGRTSALTPSDLKDLTAYLRSL